MRVGQIPIGGQGDVARPIDDLGARVDARHGRETGIGSGEKFAADRRGIGREETAVRCHAALDSRVDHRPAGVGQIEEPVPFDHDARGILDRPRDRTDVHPGAGRRLRSAQVQRAGELAETLRRGDGGRTRRRIGDPIHRRDRKIDLRALLKIEDGAAGVIHYAIDLRARFQGDRSSLARGIEILSGHRERGSSREGEVPG